MATILIVDDLAANRILLVTILASQGHRLLEAVDGRQGLTVAREAHPDLVITDVLMPIMDGYELAKQLALDPVTHDIPVVFCTAHYGAREARALALAGGVADVLTKPVQTEALLTIVAAALSGQATTPAALAAATLEQAFDHEHLRLITNKLSDTITDVYNANARLRALVNIGLEFSSETDSDRLLAMVCTETRDLFGATYVMVGIVDGAGQVIHQVSTPGAHVAMRVRTGAPVTGMLGAVVAERRTFRGDARVDPAPFPVPFLEQEVQAFLIAPLASPVNVHGWIALVANEGRGFTEDDESLLVALGGQIGRTYEIGHLSEHDFLTGLPNRLLLIDRVNLAVALAQRNQHRLAMLFVDLDRFKQVNDSLGHRTGDLVLQSTARRLVDSLRSSDTVSRHGGDEFVVLLPIIGEAEEAGIVAERILAALAPPHFIEHQQLHLTATIGISIYPDDGTDGETLIRCADLAMYHAKKNDPQTFRFFEPAMNARALERQQIEAGLHRALETGEFAVHYQPRMDLETGEVAGAEALIRWMHPTRGLTLPGAFVPIAEECGLMVPIGRWVLAEACRQAQAWIDDGRVPITVSVNISAVELRDPHFLEHVGAVLHHTGLDARWLELELTESSLMQHVDSTVVVLHALEAMGVRLAIDDFGTGYSSLSYLRQFPIATLKIDRSFVRGISAEPGDTAIVCAVISLGKSLGHRVVAEGIETAAELEFLKEQQCHEGQGYYFGRPVAAAEFMAQLSADDRQDP